MTLSALRAGYASQAIDPADVVCEVFERIEREPDNPVWISLRARSEVLAEAKALACRPDASHLPLYGAPFALKDNIDVAGMPTTAGCPAFAYMPARSATVVERLLAAGALLIGKTNMDQFATGLVGTRSPYGAVRNAIDPAYIAGGSSSGSAVAVSRALVSFSLGTDTAGSGRVPAAFNNVIGHKPSRGLISAAGVVPACRSLDCVSLLASAVSDAGCVFDVLDAFDPADSFAREARRGAEGPVARPRIGVPLAGNLEFFGDTEYSRLFAEAVGRVEQIGGELHEVDIEPFLQAARLLYEGPWVAERYAALGEFIDRSSENVNPVVRTVVSQATKFTAADAFQGMYRLSALRRSTAPTWSSVDALLLPTTGTIYTRAEVEASPIALNSNLGRYTNFVNLLDLAAIALPAGFRADGLPFGISFIAPALRDRWLLNLGELWEKRVPATASLALGAHPDSVVRIVVAGAHLRGQPLNGELTSRGARLLKPCKTAPVYRLYALAGGQLPKPGMVRVAAGVPVEVELWEMAQDRFGSFVAGVAPPLTIGTVLLEDGTQALGFLCEAHAVHQARDISSFGGWLAYLRDVEGS